MTKMIKRMSKTAALLPGTLVHVGDHITENVKITVIDYNAEQFHEEVVESVDKCFPYKETQSVTWINVDGIHKVEIIEKLGNCYGVHPLILEDIANTTQRPKYEDMSDYIFVVFKMFMYDEEKEEISTEQVSMIFGNNYLISFQESEGDVFNVIRDRLRNNKGRARKLGPDYLAYSLLDAVVDNYFVVLEKLGDLIEELEEDVMAHPVPETLQSAHNIKRDLIFLRKAVWPLREVVSMLERGDSHLVKHNTHIFLRDVYEHTIQAIDTVETFRDVVGGLLDIYLSSVSNRITEVMKVLTIFAAVFIPLTFVASFYGMNFKYMPGLNWQYSYEVCLGGMGAIALSMLIYFKRKKWL